MYWYHAACHAEFQPSNPSWSNFLLTVVDFEHTILVQQSCWVLLLTLNKILLWQLWVAGKTAQPSSGHMHEKKLLSEVMAIYLIVLKVVACPACWCRGNNFPSPSNVWRRWWHLAVGHSFNLYVSLQGPWWPYVLRMPPRGDFRLWTARARATDVGQGLPLLAGVPTGSLRAKDPRARETTLGRDRKKCRCAKKTHLYIAIYIYKCLFFIPSAFFLSWPRVFPRALGSVARREPARTPHHVWALAEVHGTRPGGSKSEIRSGGDSEHVEPSRCMKTHVHNTSTG